jgi:methanogenic corrinoid protein MtbC1
LPSLEEFVQAIANIDDERVRELGKKLVASEDPKKVIEAIVEGMKVVGDKYERLEVFIPEILVISDAVMDVVRELEPRLRAARVKPEGKIVLGVVEGDIHDIGKNIVALVFKSMGWEVYDLGRDVPPSKFVEKAREVDADVVGLSGLMTQDIDPAFKTVLELRRTGARTKTIVGGGVRE